MAPLNEGYERIVVFYVFFGFFVLGAGAKHMGAKV